MSTIQTPLSARRAEHLAAIREELDRWVEILRARGAILIVLFGSLARNEGTLFSDADLLVVMPSSQGFLERTADLYRSLAPRVDLDLIAYTPAEFAEMRDRPFVRHALREGHFLYGSIAQ
jgi:predicted nucleotidyltransferase